MTPNRGRMPYHTARTTECRDYHCWIGIRRSLKMQRLWPQKKLSWNGQKRRCPWTTSFYSRDSCEGEYWHPGYGSKVCQMTVREVSAPIQWIYCKLSHIHYDMFFMRRSWKWIPWYMTATFIGSGQGKLKRCTFHSSFPDAPLLLYFEKTLPMKKHWNYWSSASSASRTSSSINFGTVVISVSRAALYPANTSPSSTSPVTEAIRARLCRVCPGTHILIHL